MKDLCECGHLKECHQPHELDIHGGKCKHCDCRIFTWTDFLWTTNEKESVSK